MHGYIELARLPSTRQEVACISDEAVGLLFGRMDSDCTPATELKTLLASLRMGCRAILGRYGRIKKPLTLLRKGITTSTLVKKHLPETDAIVKLFVVDSEHRGKGIGRALMDRFVAAAKSKRARVIALHTDQLSSWWFYEKYGFKRWGTFTEVVSSYLKGKDLEGYTYVMELERR
jgi:GNAT superfamily N-acetyltransferase